jgi:hypothetical protein
LALLKLKKTEGCENVVAADVSLIDLIKILPSLNHQLHIYNRETIEQAEIQLNMKGTLKKSRTLFAGCPQWKTL